ncbi:MAG: hypothetical protein CMO55_16830 [Verrucomicrobiales bacterium]|nr:hypothetical protein [Verrucomicrobiales bacterium]
MSFVPETASDIESSKHFELKHTTSRGIKIYIRELSEEEAETIIIGSRDDEFLSVQEDSQRLMVTIKDNEIVNGEFDDSEDTLEVLDFMVESEL